MSAVTDGARRITVRVISEIRYEPSSERPEGDRVVEYVNTLRAPDVWSVNRVEAWLKENGFK